MRIPPVSNLKNLIILMGFLAAIVFAVIIPATRTQQNCVTADQYYIGSIGADDKYCNLETKIAAAKYHATSIIDFGKPPFSQEEKRIIEDQYQYIKFISLVHGKIDIADFPELEFAIIDLAFMSLAVDGPDMDETHHLLLYGYLLTKRRLLLEEYLGSKLAFLKTGSDVVLSNDGEALGLKGSPDTFYLCYWKTFIPGFTVQETVVSPLFLRCTEEN